MARSLNLLVNRVTTRVLLATIDFNTAPATVGVFDRVGLRVVTGHDCSCVTAVGERSRGRGRGTAAGRARGRRLVGRLLLVGGRLLCG